MNRFKDVVVAALATLLVVASLQFVTACTKQQGAQVVTVGSAVCEVGYVLIHVEDPAIPDLCATIAEFVQAVANLNVAAAAAMKATALSPPPPTSAQIRAEVVRLRAVAGGAK